MNRSPAKKRRERAKASEARRKGEVVAQPRLGGAKLSRIERNKLRAGCLKRIQPKDTIRILATRLDQSEACIREALSHDIRMVDEVLKGNKCSDIAKMGPELVACLCRPRPPRHIRPKKLPCGPKTPRPQLLRHAGSALRALRSEETVDRLQPWSDQTPSDRKAGEEPHL